jgi:hypothetical protein
VTDHEEQGSPACHVPHVIVDLGESSNPPYVHQRRHCSSSTALWLISRIRVSRNIVRCNCNTFHGRISITYFSQVSNKHLSSSLPAAIPCLPASLPSQAHPSTAKIGSHTSTLTRISTNAALIDSLAQISDNINSPYEDAISSLGPDNYSCTIFR